MVLTLTRDVIHAGPDALESGARPHCYLPMPTLREDSYELATAICAGPLHDATAVEARVRPLIANMKNVRWLRPLSRRVADTFAGGPRPAWREVVREVELYEPFRRAWRLGKIDFASHPVAAEMAPARGAPQTWRIPTITSLPALAKTLRLHLDDLGWLIAPGQSAHYLYQWKQKRKSTHYRLLEIPKPLLKLAQRGILHKILAPIPPHEAAEGFRPERSVQNFVEPHCHQQLVLRLDLEGFFPSISAPLVRKFFMTAGYPEEISNALTTLCTNAVDPAVLHDRHLSWNGRKRLATAHLPQGAPTSPALANLCAFRLDCRLAGLARTARANYTRYADDLLFSGDKEFARQAQRFTELSQVIILESGFLPNHRKTRLLRPGQRQAAAGLILNEKPNIDRREFDRLKAILTNCHRFGPESQNHAAHPNYREHLQGKIAWQRFVNPTRGENLLRLFERISWTE